MGELDQVFDNYSKKNKQYNKEEWIEYKKQEKQEVYALIDTTAERIVKDGQEFKKYLDTQSKFEQYSVANNLLITAQMPEATALRDYNSWKSIGGFPKKNRRNDVKILEPADSYMRDDGSVGTNYNVKYLTDISQVSIRKKPNTMMRYDNKLLLRVFLNSSQAKVEVVNEIPNTNRSALYDIDKDVLYIARGAEAPQIFYEVTQELAKQEIGENTELDAFKANCVSYMVCKKYGIDVSNYNVTDIPYEFKEMSAKEIREKLEPIHDAMENIIGRTSHCIDLFSKQNREKEQAR